MFYLTGFQPFGGRVKNGSKTLLDSLAQEPALKGVYFQILDVTWESFDAFYRQIARRPVSGIIGFGEGEKDSIVVELVGKNISSGFDECGVQKENRIIKEQDPPTNHSRITIPESQEIQKGQDAGEFLCNYELFLLNRMDVSISAFVHLPPQGETPDGEYLARVKPPVLDLLRSNLPFKQASL